LPTFPSRAGRRRFAVRTRLVLSFALVASLAAQEASFGVGRLHGLGHARPTYAWSVQYFHYLEPRWALGLGWLNEGHLDNHHRDGPYLQAWRFHRIPTNNLRLGVGLGVYRSFDTTSPGEGEPYRNDHALKPILGLRAVYPIAVGRWGVFAQATRILGPENRQTQSVMLGLTGRFGKREFQPEPQPVSEAPRQELSFLFGRTILNSLSSETTGFLEPFALEYRRQLGRHLAFSVAYTDEGDLEEAKRDGLSALLWVTNRSVGGAWLLGMGAGPYVNRSYPMEHAADQRVNIRTSIRYALLLGRDLGGHWGARLQWNRTVTRNHRDTDILLAGLAYQW